MIYNFCCLFSVCVWADVQYFGAAVEVRGQLEEVLTLSLVGLRDSFWFLTPALKHQSRLAGPDHCNFASFMFLQPSSMGDMSNLKLL